MTEPQLPRVPRSITATAWIPVLLVSILASACDVATPRDSNGVAATDTAAPTAPPATEPTAAFKPIKLHGRGDKVARFRIPKNVAAIAEITHEGSANFVVSSIDRNGNENDLLVNTIGDYEGTVLFDEQNGQHSVAFKIQADGKWTARILPLDRAKKWNGRTKLSGRGDSVIRLSPPSSGLATTRITHNGESNFVVYAYGDSAELLVNEIGRYRGESLLPSGTVLFEVNADGAWTFGALK